MTYWGGKVSNVFIETEMFKIYFSLDKCGRDFKFQSTEKSSILEAVKWTEGTILKISGFSQTSPTGSIYKIPVIFEKLSTEKFLSKHQNHLGMISFPPIGEIWNGTSKYKGIEIKSRTAVISLSPMEKDHFFSTVCHEVIHAFFDSFLTPGGVNLENKVYFLEGLTEWLTKLTVNRVK